MTEEHTPSLDFIRPFLLGSSRVRGRIARLDDTLTNILSRHEYPEAVRRLVGETLVICALIATGLKIKHRFSVQVKTDAEIKLLMAEYNVDGTMRAYASFDDGAHGVPIEQAYTLIGRGTMTMIVEQGAGTQPYQGIVPLEGGDLAESVEIYFGQSDQIPTSVRLCFVEEHEPGACFRVSGIMIQQLPDHGGVDAPAASQSHLDDAFPMAHALLHTVRDDELIVDHDEANNLLFKLFHEMDVSVFEDHHISFGCSCSWERIGRAICLYDAEGVENMTNEAQVEANCQFCGAHYEFQGERLKSWKQQP